MEIGLAALDHHLDTDVQSTAAPEMKVLLAAFGVSFRPVPRRVVLVKLERIFYLLFVHVVPPDDMYLPWSEHTGSSTPMQIRVSGHHCARLMGIPTVFFLLLN